MSTATVRGPAERPRGILALGLATWAVRDASLEASREVHNIALGHVANAIVDAANDKRIDLIVMGSLGLSDVQSLLLGSVTHRVMQMAKVAVLVDRRIGSPAPVTAAM